MAKKKPSRSKAKKSSKKRTRGAGPSLSSLMGRMGMGGGCKAPKGFRAISMTQAMMEFANPIMEHMENGTVDDPNEALQIGVALWNFTLSADVPEKKSQKDLIQNISKTLRLEPQEAEAFFDRMVERKAYLFPDEIQPKGAPTTMFMRKETEYQIVQFDESQLHLSDDAVPDTEKDRKLHDDLLRMDRYLEEEADYDDWESHFLSVRELCQECFEEWLGARGCPENYTSVFPVCADMLLAFLYQYDGCGLRNVSKNALDEFFMDFVMRKTLVKPPEYTYWPPALRLLFAYLAEKGYLENAAPMIKSISEIEPKFVDMVKDRT